MAVVRIATASGGSVAAAVGGEADLAVVFEAGSPGDAGTWSQTTPLVRQFARTVAYNRGGYEPSDAVRWPRRMPAMAEDLLSVVRATTDVPAVIVAHSGGGLIARLALREAPELFCAAVLVDSTPVVGLPVMARLSRDVADPNEEIDFHHAALDCDGLDEPEMLGALPLAVLWAGRDNIPDTVPTWYRDFFRDRSWRPALEKLSTRTQVVELADCSHNVPTEDPQAVASAVASVIHLARGVEPH